VPIVFAVVVSAGLVAPEHVVAASAQPRDPVTILDRVFSVAQAERGEARFKQSCAPCHRGTEFVEPAFSERWEGRTVGDLFAYISTTMPPNEQDRLKGQDYAAVIAFFLGQNGYPVGYDDLPADRTTLDGIGIVANPK
jgi:mono/diheme cytochrome c family protein